MVDDEPLIGTMVELTLHLAQYRTKVFKDPVVAVETFRNADPKPDLLLTDFNMPGMTGIDLIRECKAVHPPLRTIICSGTVDEGFLRALTPQPDKFIAKPFFPQELLEVMKSLLGTQNSIPTKPEDFRRGPDSGAATDSTSNGSSNR